MANDRLSQIVVEGVVSPTSQKGRTSQLITEAVVQVTSAKTRVSQMVVEVIVVPIPPGVKPQVQVFESFPMTYFG